MLPVHKTICEYHGAMSVRLWVRLSGETYRGINRVRRKKEPRMELASRGLVDSDFRWRSFELTHFNCACSSSNNVKFHRL